MNKIIKQCPVCSSQMMVKSLGCDSCHTQVSGEFEMPTSKIELEDELFDFLKVFIFAEGSIKQSEKLLNCSYPKIKNLLKKTKVALGLQGDEQKGEESIIDRLDKGEINVEEALKVLRSKK